MLKSLANSSFVNVRELFTVLFGLVFGELFTVVIGVVFGGATADCRRRSGALVYNKKFHQNVIAHLVIQPECFHCLKMNRVAKARNLKALCCIQTHLYVLPAASLLIQLLN